MQNPTAVLTTHRPYLDKIADLVKPKQLKLAVFLEKMWQLKTQKT